MGKKEEKKVTPMHFCIEEKDVEKQYDCESFCLYKAGGFMHYMTKGGYHVFVKPSYDALYSTLETLLDVLIQSKEDGDNKADESLMNMADFVSSLMFAPTILFSDDETAIEAFEFLNKSIEKMYKKAASELLGEDFDKNNEYESAVKSAEELVENLKGIADALPEENNEQ